MGDVDRQLRVGILGCGPIAQFAHFESVQKAYNTVVYAVCDVDQELATHFGQFYDAQRIYFDYQQMLDDPRVEAIIIATSDAFHVPAALKALAVGKHVLCEKPIGIAVEEVETLETAVKTSGKVLQIGHMLRFDPGIESAAEFVSGEMGEMLALKAWYCDNTRRYTLTRAIQPLPRKGNRTLRPAADPKVNRPRYYMLAHGSHVVDLARFLGGPIRSVQARLSQKVGAYCWFVDLDFESGTLGHLDLTIGVRMDWHEGFQIYGENGSVSAKLYNPWFYKSSDVELFHEGSATTTRVLGADAHFYRRQVEGFAETVLLGKPMRGADIQDGVASIKTMVAIAQSASSGRPVEVASATGAL